jgi:pilus assembly protein Flp/PilA
MQMYSEMPGCILLAVSQLLIIRSLVEAKSLSMVDPSTTVSFFKGIPSMLKTFIGIREAALRLRDNQDGVVSFEYVIVAACIVVAVGFAFGTTTGGTLARRIHDVAFIGLT